MIKRIMVKAAPIINLFCGDVEHCMEYVLEKGHAILSVG
jgi:hypothetical protein